MALNRRWQEALAGLAAAGGGVGGLQAPTQSSAAPVPMGQGGTFDSSGPADSFDSTGPSSPVDVLQAGMEAYKAQGRQDPLEALLGTRKGPDGGFVRPGHSPVQQVVDDSVQGINRVAQITSHGPREGKAHTTFDLGNGLKANVYFDANGRRKTFVFHS